MNAQTSPRYVTDATSTVYDGVRYAPTTDPAWATASGAGIPDGTLACLYGSDKAAPAAAGILVWVHRSGRTVRAVDANTRHAVDEWSASARRWIVAATETINQASDGFESHSRRTDECRKCDQSIDAHSHVEPVETSRDGSTYAHLADRLHPVYVPPAPAVTVCTDASHVEGARGCALPKCAGTPSVDMLTSRGEPVPAAPVCGEYGTVGRSIALALADMTGADVTMPVYRDSQWCDVRDRRQAQGWTLAVQQPGRYVTITFLTFETRTALTLWRPVWVVLVDGNPVIDADGSALVNVSGMRAEHIYATLAHRAACAIGARDAYGLSVPGWTLPESDNSTDTPNGAPLGWDCCQAAPAALVVWDNGRTSAVCRKDADTYARRNGEAMVLPLPGAPAAPEAPAPAPVAPGAPAALASEAPTEATIETVTQESIMDADTTPAPTTTPAAPAESAVAAPEAPTGDLSATVDRKSLTDALAFLVKATDPRPALPILAGVEITAEDGSLTLRTFDYDSERSVTLPAHVDASGRITVACKTLTNVAKSDVMTNARVTLTVRPGDADRGFDQRDMTVTSGGSAVAMDVIEGDALPGLPFRCKALTSLDVRTLAPALAAVAGAASTDEVLPALHAAQITVSDGAIDMQATDRYRAVWGYMTATGARDAFLCPPARTVAEAVKVMAKVAGKGGAPIVIGDHQPRRDYRWMSLMSGGYRLTVRMYDTDKAMPLDALISTDMRHVGTVDGAALASAVKVVADQRENKTYPVLLSWSASAVTVHAADVRPVSVPCEYTGDPIVIGLNPLYLVGALAPVKGRVTFSAYDARKGVLVTPAGGAEAPAGYRHLICPVRIDGVAPAAPAATNTDRKETAVTTDTTPARKTPARKARKTPAPVAPKAPAPAPVAAPVTAPEAPAAPATIGSVERIAAEALTAFEGGDYAGALAVIDRAEAEAPAGYRVAGRLTFDQVRGQITARRDASAPAPAPEAPAPTYAPVAMTHGAEGTALVKPPFVLRYKLSETLNGRRGGLGWTWNKRDRWILDGSAGQPVDTARVAAAVAALAKFGLTVDDQTGVAVVAPAPVSLVKAAPAAPAPVVTPAPAAEVPAPVVSASDTAVIDAARSVAVDVMTGAVEAPVSVVFDIPATVDTSGGFKPVLLPVKRAMVAAGVRVFLTRVGHRVTIVPQSGVMTDAMRLKVCAVMRAYAPTWAPVLVPVSV